MVAGEISELILKNFGHRTEPAPVAASGAGPGKKLDPAVLDAGLKVAAIMVSVPASLLASLKAVERFKKKPQAEKLLEGTKDALKDHPGAEIRIRKADGTHIQVRGMDADSLLDIFTEAVR